MIGKGSTPDSLAIEVQGIMFSSTEYDKLVNFLSAQERVTESWPIDDESQIALTRKGRTISGDRLSWLAMRQICKSLSSGLATSLSDLIGMRRITEDMDRPPKIKADPDDDFTVGEAASLYNLAVKKRFGRLFGFQVVRNTETKVIEAVVGMKYKRISNSDFLSAVSGIIDSLDLKFQFRSASLFDRKISIIYTLKGYEDCYLTPGLLISNSEIGDAAIKATVILISSTDSIMSAAYGRLGRVAHSGRDLLGKLSQLITGVSSRLTNNTFTKDNLNKRIEANRSKSLGFKGLGEDEERFKQILEFLTDRCGMTYATAKKCLSKTLAGADIESSTFSLLERSKTWPAKSTMCLVEMITKECRDQFLLSFYSKDKLERIAWLMFFNKLSVPDVTG